MTFTGVLEIFVYILGVGMLFAAISVTIAGALEIFVYILGVGMLFAATSVTITGVLDIFVYILGVGMLFVTYYFCDFYWSSVDLCLYFRCGNVVCYLLFL